MLLILFTLISIVNFAQINLEHTFSGIAMTNHVNTNNQTMYYDFNSTTSVLTLYNNDYSLYKSLTITPPAGYKSPALAGTISTKIFNNDDLVEFGIYYMPISTSYPMELKLILYNENLQVLKDFGSRMGIDPFMTVNNVLKCNVYGFVIYSTGTTYYNDIYNLPGTLPVSVLNELPSVNDISPFPNPTNTYIVIPFTLGENESTILNVFNQNGQIVDSKIINGHVSSLRYDVNRLSPGLYFYQYKNVKSKFIVSK